MTREVWEDPTGQTADYVRERLDFAGARQVVMLRKTVATIKTGKAEQECWFLITSVPPERATPEWMMRKVREHWKIENKLHHVKDRTWREDDQKTRQAGLGAVLALLRTVAVNALQLARGFGRWKSMASRSRHCLFQPMRAMRLAGIKK